MENIFFMDYVCAINKTYLKGGAFVAEALRAL
jgi:hypothetical protein